MSDAPLLTFPHFISGGSIGFLSLREGKFFGGRLLMSDAPLIKGEAASSHVLLLGGLSIYNVFLLSIFILLNIRKVIIIYFTSFIHWRIYLIQFNPFVDIRNHFFAMLCLIQIFIHIFRESLRVSLLPTDNIITLLIFHAFFLPLWSFQRRRICRR